MAGILEHAFHADGGARFHIIRAAKLEHGCRIPADDEITEGERIARAHRADQALQRSLRTGGSEWHRIGALARAEGVDHITGLEVFNAVGANLDVVAECGNAAGTIGECYIDQHPLFAYARAHWSAERLLHDAAEQKLVALRAASLDQAGQQAAIGIHEACHDQRRSRNQFGGIGKPFQHGVAGCLD